MRPYHRHGIVVAAALMIAAVVPHSAAAQAFPDLVGTWSLDTRASDFGMSQPVSSGTLVFERADSTLVLIRTAAGMGGERTTRFDQPIDGQVHQATGPGGPTDSQAEWDGATLVLSVTAESNVGPLPITERFTVSEDGNTLTISRSIAVPGMGDMVQTLVFGRAGEG